MSEIADFADRRSDLNEAYDISSYGKRFRRGKLEVGAKKYVEPERDDGNNEYKLKLLNKTEKEIEHLTSQMRYRMEEGKGECIYTVGITDNGGVIGITQDEYEDSKCALETICEKNNYSIRLLTSQAVDNTKKVYEFLIRENIKSKYIDIKVACAGNVDVGKSSLLGVLLTGQKDDGRGKSRLNVFNFAHEVTSGRTSSVAQHILGFRSTGEINTILDSHGHKKSWPEIINESTKIITLFDLCGHEKYLKTTIFGLTSQLPDFVMILVGANMGITKITKEHIFLCLSLGIPFIIVITKIDITENRSNVLKETVDDVKRLLKLPGIRRIPYDVRTTEDVIISSKNINSYSTVPIFYVSNVTGQGMDLLREFLNVFIKKPVITNNENKTEIHIEQSFQITGVGIVVGGQLLHGKVRVGDKLLLGPNNGVYTPVQVKSIHCKRVPVEDVDTSTYVCLGLKKVDKSAIRKGSVILSVKDVPYQVARFEADVRILKSHSTTIKIGYEPVVHTHSIRQIAKIVEIKNKVCNRNVNDESDNVLRTGDRATIVFEFKYRGEYMKLGARLLFAEGHVKIIGKVIHITKEICRIDSI
jgi:GTPase